MGKKPTDDFIRGHKDGNKHGSWHREHPWQSGAGLGPDIPREKDNDDYNAGVRAGREAGKKGK